MGDCRLQSVGTIVEGKRGVLVQGNTQGFLFDRRTGGVDLVGSNRSIFGPEAVTLLHDRLRGHEVQIMKTVRNTG